MTTKLALYGNFGRHNIGNECTLAALLVHLRRRGGEIIAFGVCSDPQIVKGEHGLDCVAISTPEPAPRPGSPAGAWRLPRKLLYGVPRQLRELWRAYRLLRGADALVLVGTGMLEDEDGGTAWPLTTLRWVLAARARRCRVVVLGIGAGPFQTRATRLLSTAILRAADYVSYRDRESKDYVHAAGLDTSRHVVVPDLAFSLPLEQTAGRAQVSQSRATVALGVIDRSKFSSDAQYRSYLQVLCGFAEHLLAEGHSVRVIHGDGLYDHESLGALRDLFGSAGILGDTAKLSIPPIASLNDLLVVLRDVDLVIASRYHNMILALMLGKPVLALSYHWKFASVMSDFGLGRYERPVRDCELAWLIDRSREILQMRAELGQRITKTAEACRSSVIAQYGVVLASGEDTPGGVR